MKSSQGFMMGFLRSSKVGERSSASCRKSFSSFLKAIIYYPLVFKEFPMDLSHGVFRKWHKVFCHSSTKSVLFLLFPSTCI